MTTSIRESIIKLKDKRNKKDEFVEGKINSNRKTQDKIIKLNDKIDAYRIVADFETTIDEPVRVYRWYAYIADLDMWFDGWDIQSFIDFIKLCPHSDVFFHNSKFDGSFIIDYLIRNGVIHNERLQANKLEYVIGDFDNFTYYWNFNCYANIRDTMSLLKGSLAQLGDKIGLKKGDTTKDAYYTNKEVDNLTNEQIDRLNKYCKLDVEILAKIMEKYHLYHLFNIANTQAQLAYRGLTQEVLETSEYNVKPRNKLKDLKPKKIKQINKYIYVKPKNGKQKQYFKLSDWETFTKFKKCNYEVLEIKEKEETVWNKDYLIMNVFKNSMTEYVIPIEYFQFYNQMFPYKRYSDNKDTRKQQKKIIDITNGYAQSSYKGGLNYVNPKYQNKWIDKRVYQYDINSMYPWIYSSLPIPNTLTKQQVKYLNKTDLGLIAIDLLKAKCKDGKLPLIKLKTDTKTSMYQNRDNVDKYLDNFYYDELFVLTNLEYQYLLENYDIEEINVVNMFRFQRNYLLENCFKRYCDYWYNKKLQARSNENKIDEYFAKLMLNALYGKFGQYGKRYDRFNYKINSDTNSLERIYDGRYENDKFSGADVLVASYITAYARVYLANAINKIGLDNFIYCDTDSIHCFISPDDLKSDLTLNFRKDETTFTNILNYDGISIGLGIGQFKFEGYSDISKYIQNKTYGHEFKELKNGKWQKVEWKTTCAGFDEKIPKEQFQDGMKVNVRRSVLVNGGTKLETRQQQLGLQWTENKIKDLCVLD